MFLMHLKDDSDGGESSMRVVHPPTLEPNYCAFGIWNRERRKVRLYFLTNMYSFATFQRSGDKRLLELTWN
jgi:hypothetical protein